MSENQKKALSGTGVTIGRLVVFILAVAGLFILFYFLGENSNEEYRGDIVRSWVALASNFVLVVTLVIIGLVLRKFVRLFIKRQNGFSLFGPNLPERFMGFGVITLLFPEAIYSILATPVRLSIDMLQGMPQEVRAISGTIDVTQNYTLAEISNILSTTFQSAMLVAVDAVNKAFINFPITDFILGIALWVLFGQLLKSVVPDETKGGSFGDTQLARLIEGIKRFVREIKPARLQNIFLALVFLLSTYLIIAAIVAIPWLESTMSTEDFNKDELRLRLQASLFQPASLESRYHQEFDSDTTNVMVKIPLDFPVNPDTLDAVLGPILYKTYSEQVQVDTSVITKRTTQASASSLFSFSSDDSSSVNILKRHKENWDRSRSYSEVLQRRSEFHQAYLQLLRSASEKQEEALNVSVNKVEAYSLSKMSQQGYFFYIQSLNDWVVENSNRLRRYLEKGLSLLKTEDDNLENWILAETNRMKQQVTILESIANESYMWPAMQGIFLYREGPDYLFPASIKQAYFEPLDLDSPPLPAEPGLEFGIFGYISNWLLKTKSFALTLITGMFGFGLFGAAISSFIREERTRDPDGPLVQNITSLLVRGLSAAIVIFLAAKGGLAVFTTGEQQLNPYVLFFTCLVGSVFSESVWAWAHSKLGELTNDEHKDKMNEGVTNVENENLESPVDASENTDAEKKINDEENNDSESGG